MSILMRALGCFVLTCLVGGADWPQWRGPYRDGHSTESVKPWTGNLPVVWKLEVGEGHSSPVVADGRVFLHTKSPGREVEVIQAYDAGTGESIWKSSYERGSFTSQFGNGPRATPTVDSNRIFTLGVTGYLGCWDTSSGKKIWMRNILEDFDASNLFFGTSSTPIIDGPRLLIMVGGPQASIVALDKETGNTIWKSGGDKASYSSPILTEIAGHKTAVFLTQQGVIGLNPATGKEFWKFPLVDKLNESSTTPVRAGDSLFASSVTYGSVGLQLIDDNGSPGFKQLWKNPKLPCYFSTPVAVDDHLYVVTGQIFPPAAHLRCIETKTGKLIWTKQNVGKYHATVMTARDKILMLEEEGDLVLIDPSSTKYVELARAKICGHTWAHPAIVDGNVIVRDDHELVCVRFP